MTHGYTDEVNAQILLALMKYHRVSIIVASPGTTNISLVASAQQDPFFTVLSSPEERSAAYIACGIAAESGQPVAISCTGATASRNYLPGLTEAFYRKLPVLAVTSSQHFGRIGHSIPQVIDRRSSLVDTCRLSVQIPTVLSDEDRWACEMSLNEALLELRHDGGGPVHVNLATNYSRNFDVKTIPQVRVVDRIIPGDQLPDLTGKKMAVFVGAHAAWDERSTRAIDAFCAAYDGVVVCDHTSNYQGEYRVDGALALTQMQPAAVCNSVDVLIHIGDVSGAYLGFRQGETWRVNPDGKLRDSMGRLRYVFEMSEAQFFEAYAGRASSGSASGYLETWRSHDARLRERIPELPFSNAWIAQQTTQRLPDHSVVHLGILNTLRCWNFFPMPQSVRAYANTGGFGIDGCVSTLIGASLASPERLCFGVVGDLAAFYDLNALGNRHIGNNLRLVVVNNGVGAEFKLYSHRAAVLGDDADAFVAARGHYGRQSRDLLRHYAEDLGFEYFSASTKAEFLAVLGRLVTPDTLERPVLFEVFTDSKDESDALEMIASRGKTAVGVTKQVVQGVLGERGSRALKAALRSRK